jgi:hypothetical protein
MQKHVCINIASRRILCHQQRTHTGSFRASPQNPSLVLCERDILFLDGFHSEETAFMGMGIADQVVDSRLVEKRGDEVGWDGVEGQGLD